MTDYNVKQISEMLGINPETVRRWIRSGKLVAEQTSKKDGNVVSQEDLIGFLKSMPKYSGLVAGMVAASAPAVGMPFLMGTLAGGVMGVLSSKQDSMVSKVSLQKSISSEIDSLKTRVAIKKETVKQLQTEIEADEQTIAELTNALEQIDLQVIANNIDSK